jgi:hypothetical protein
MRRLLIPGLVVLIAGVIYALFPRSKSLQTTPAESDLVRSELAPPISPPRLAVVRTEPDANADTRMPAADEATLMRQLRISVRANPTLAEALAREGRERFPGSADADERDALLVDALINQQRIGAARSETYYYFDHHATGRFGEHLFVMTGVHPTPKGPGRP